MDARFRAAQRAFQKQQTPQTAESYVRECDRISFVPSSAEAAEVFRTTDSYQAAVLFARALSVERQYPGRDVADSLTETLIQLPMSQSGIYAERRARIPHEQRVSYFVPVAFSDNRSCIGFHLYEHGVVLHDNLSHPSCPLEYGVMVPTDLGSLLLFLDRNWALTYQQISDAINGGVRSVDEDMLELVDRVETKPLVEVVATDYELRFNCKIDIKKFWNTYNLSLTIRRRRRADYIECRIENNLLYGMGEVQGLRLSGGVYRELGWPRSEEEEEDMEHSTQDEAYEDVFCSAEQLREYVKGYVEELINLIT